MVDFRDNPWLGEALHLARENGVLLSLICHAPVAMTSTLQRVDSDGRAYRAPENPFFDATITTVPERGGRAPESAGYVHVPRQRTRLTYYVDEVLKKTGFTLRTGLNPVRLEADLRTGRRSTDRQRTTDHRRPGPQDPKHRLDTRSTE
jgi:hypothetical protein